MVVHAHGLCYLQRWAVVRLQGPLDCALVLAALRAPENGRTGRQTDAQTDGRMDRQMIHFQVGFWWTSRRAVSEVIQQSDAPADSGQTDRCEQGDRRISG